MLTPLEFCTVKTSDMIKQSDTLERIKWRIDNRYWIRKSQYVALQILKCIDEKKYQKMTLQS